MTKLIFDVKGQEIKRTDDISVVADSQNYLTAEFGFSDKWSAPVTAIFGYGGTFYSILLEDNQCTVPWEVIKAPFFTVSVFCGDRITANVVQVPVEKSGYVEGETPKEPTSDVYSKIVELSEETRNIAQSVRDDADKGVFDGLQGPQGEKGDTGAMGQDGYTPERGVDYWTDEDKAEIKSYVDEAILGGSW